MIVLFGFTTHDRRTPPTVIYCGTSGDEAAAGLAASSEQFVRVGKLVNPQLIPVSLPARADVATPTEPASEPAPKSSKSKK